MSPFIELHAIKEDGSQGERRWFRLDQIYAIAEHGERSTIESPGQGYAWVYESFDEIQAVASMLMGVK